jgi:hypothetical protein
MKTAFILIAIYIAQVGALWGVLGGYTYFKDDSLKAFLGEFWIALYIIPIFTTIIYIVFRGVKETNSTNEIILTEGDHSPGRVAGSYSVGLQPESNGGNDSLHTKSREEPHEEEIKAEKKLSIKTKGNYSPGCVGGDYKIEK